jgi:hypothetical protein
MGCGCSGQRASLRTTTLRAAAPREREVAPTGAALAYVGSGRLSLRGPFSGRVYRVGPEARRIDADPRDLAALIRTRLFVVPG